MFEPNQYELLDFGGGRKLERFGAYVLDRPAPAAIPTKPVRPELWRTANARFEIDSSPRSGPQRGVWKMAGEPLPAWTIRHGDIALELKLTDFGHVGVFPEQAACWDWIGDRLRPAPTANVLNLFAYTGGSTLTAAASAAVTHVDSAANTVGWARKNAELSAMSQAPIRWIVEDAMKFAQRELRRGRHYDAVVLDPPSYGHGASGETWQIDGHLPELLSTCRELTGGEPRFVLLTCHAPGYDPTRLAECLAAAGFASDAAAIDADDLWLSPQDGRRLHCGVYARLARLKAD
jgi:23S rRNA (cytosine1962-C5)-methyltransferase